MNEYEYKQNRKYYEKKKDFRFWNEIEMLAIVKQNKIQ